MPKDAEKILTQLGSPQNPTPENPLYNEIIGQLPSYLQMKNSPSLPKDMPLIVMYATKHCLPIAWTKKPMCMTSKQEIAHEKGQVEMYNMSENHKLIRVDGGHMSFFDNDKSGIVLNALYDVLRMSQLRVNKIAHE